MDHVQLIYDIGELSGIFATSLSIETILQKIVEMVAKHMKADVCSIYLYDEEKEGKVASEGFAYSNAIVLDNEKSFDSMFNMTFDRQFTLEDFENTLRLSEKQLETLRFCPIIKTQLNRIPFLECGQSGFLSKTETSLSSRFVPKGEL